MSAAAAVGGGVSTLDAVRSLWARAGAAHPPASPGARAAADHVARLDAPLRVAVAGMVKAGKSTLVNALIGDEIAPTDAGECTRVVTWYEHGTSPQVLLRAQGRQIPLPVRRRHGRLQLDLAGIDPRDVERLSVAWPAPALSTVTLIDTPGISSVDAETSARSAAFVTPADAPSAADAVVYLMRHLHGGDVRFLESFRDTAAGASAPAATIAVLSRADEVGSGRIDALLSASAVAARYRAEPALRAVCQTVVPVAGLLACGAQALRHQDFVALRALAALDRQVLAAQLVSVDRFVASGREVTGDDPGPQARAALLDRFGVFGVRLAVTLLRAGLNDPTELARDLVRRSGLEDLRQLVAVRFAGRSGALKARTSVLALERFLREHPAPGAQELLAEAERVRAGAHDLREVAALTLVRSGDPDTLATLSPEELADAEALLGACGADAVHRLRLAGDGPGDGVGADVATGVEDAGVSVADVRQAALSAVSRWRRLAGLPLQSRASAHLCDVVVRSAEGILASLPEPPGR